MTFLIIGGSGLLGRELVRQRDGRATTATDSRSLDIRRRDDVFALFERLRPAVAVNAAYRQDDWAITADGAATVAAAAARTGTRLVHVSSDAIFGGRPEPYDEDSLPGPTSAYGAAKAAAETAVRGLTPDAVIARTSLIIGDGDSPQERLVHALATGVRDGALFTDDIRCPVHVTDLAAAILELAADPGRHGVHHLAGPDAISRHRLGVLVARRDGLDETRLRPALRAETALPGGREVRLDSTRTTAGLRTRLRGPGEFLILNAGPPEPIVRG
ncbi:sugar nucleotide-binding protein [Actinoplanes sp. NBRC 101535]|uniref:sugar nucleotide-binding protein n=1 Tax=Actinoplanes sp. NBRC 101535 TaxID=3032196 RepID=UPI0024A5D314|nr:sugar nucleotide-binding protein [Actinoplanes sp. NBRC 101535]GLY02869.1 dTDP-4-dehydrorhamnose reductase [Actinoplanes sp. NBRC 101535]